jgi:hypothetical protein
MNYLRHLLGRPLSLVVWELVRPLYYSLELELLELTHQTVPSRGFYDKYRARRHDVLSHCSDI